METGLRCSEFETTKLSRWPFLGFRGDPSDYRDERHPRRPFMHHSVDGFLQDFVSLFVIFRKSKFLKGFNQIRRWGDAKNGFPRWVVCKMGRKLSHCLMRWHSSFVLDRLDVCIVNSFPFEGTMTMPCHEMIYFPVKQVFETSGRWEFERRRRWSHFRFHTQVHSHRKLQLLYQYIIVNIWEELLWPLHSNDNPPRMVRYKVSPNGKPGTINTIETQVKKAIYILERQTDPQLQAQEWITP